MHEMTDEQYEDAMTELAELGQQLIEAVGRTRDAAALRSVMSRMDTECRASAAT